MRLDAEEQWQHWGTQDRLLTWTLAQLHSHCLQQMPSLLLCELLMFCTDIVCYYNLKDKKMPKVALKQGK
jgi:hypothetical protein